MSTLTKKTPAKKSPGKKKASNTAPKKDLHEALHQYFGFKKFKGTQEKAIESLLAGHDTFVIMPPVGARVYAINYPP